MDRLHSMRVFARVIEQGSFAGAARELNLSPAVVTRLVADLEEHLGARLINRTTRRLSLTDIGERYLERVHHVLTEIEEAESLASDATAQPPGHLRVLCSPAFAVHQIAKHLPRFRAQYPQVTLDLAAPGPVETVDENYDVSILTEGRRPLDGSFIARRLACTEVVLCASPEYLDRRGRPTHPNELLQHDAMVPAFVREMAFHHGPWGDDESAGETVTIAPGRAALSTIHIDTMYAAALAGMGVTGLPSYVAEDALLENALERVLPEWGLMRFTLYAGMPTRKYVPARTRAFVDFLVQTFGGGEDDPWLLAAGCETRRSGATPKPAPGASA
jgi:DNA-binding transcriptional LysR family regulator